MLAFAKLLDTPLEAVIAPLRDHYSTEVYDYESYVPFSIHDVAVNPEHVKRMKKRNEMLRSWFSEK